MIIHITTAQYFLDPCEYIKYEAQTLSYDKFSSITIIPDNNDTNNLSDNNQIAREDEDKMIIFYYYTTEIEVITVDLLINFSNFLSAIGGNLGMFIGFSFFGCFASGYDAIKRICKDVISNQVHQSPQ